MSGIIGIVNLDRRPLAQVDLQPMLETITRRGADGARIWIEGHAGLGHAMLWTTPESLSERPPLVNNRSHLAITADVRLDNREELIRILGLGDRPAAEIGDHELILGAYEKWAEKCPTKLLGAFAFAIWDGRRQLLFCARDHLGVKPFYYFHHPGQCVAFASQARAVLAAPQVPLRLNEGRIADYLITKLEGIDNTSTFYLDVVRLPPAHWMAITVNGMISQCYWSLDPTQEIHCAGDEEYIAAFREIFFEAVSCRLRVNSFPASMLSGGMDSSAIVGAARMLLAEDSREHLHTFSAVAGDETACVESRSIRAVLAQGKVAAHTVSPVQLHPHLNDFDYVIKNSDDPFDILIAHVPLTMYSAAHGQGARVLLDGIGGDEATTHNLSYYLSFLLRDGKWRAFLRELHGSNQFYRSFSTVTYWNSILQYALRPLTPLSIRRLFRAFFGPANAHKLATAIGGTAMRPDFAQAVNLGERLRKLSNPQRFRTMREQQAFNLANPGLTAALERYDRVAASLMIEPRHPFLDKRFVEFCLALPWQYKIQRGWTKISLRRAMIGILPDEVVWRRGWEHLGPDFSRAWYLSAVPFIEEILREPLDAIDKYVDTPAVRDAHRRFMLNGSWPDGRTVLFCVGLASWYNSL